MVFGVVKGGLADSQQNIMAHPTKAMTYEQVHLVISAEESPTEDS